MGERERVNNNAGVDEEINYLRGDFGIEFNAKQWATDWRISLLMNSSGKILKVMEIINIEKSRKERSVNNTFYGLHNVN